MYYKYTHTTNVYAHISYSIHIIFNTYIESHVYVYTILRCYETRKKSMSWRDSCEAGGTSSAARREVGFRSSCHDWQSLTIYRKGSWCQSNIGHLDIPCSLIPGDDFPIFFPRDACFCPDLLHALWLWAAAACRLTRTVFSMWVYHVYIYI